MIHFRSIVTFSIICLIFFSCQEKRNLTNEATSHQEAATSSDQDKSEGTKEALFGDLHIHSGWSFDAFIYNVRTTPDDAYRYAKGETIDIPGVGEIRSRRPLDFAAVTDHSEYMGVMMEMIRPNSAVGKLDIAQRVRSQDRTTSVNAFGEIGRSIATNEAMEDLAEKSVMTSTWNKAVQIADDHNVPGTFTTFPAYEWTSSPQFGNDPENLYAANLHRNVIYRGDKVSDLPFSSFNSQDPQELWKWMEQEKQKGIDLIAIPHNANMSDGLMFPKETFSGQPLDEEYARLRYDNEPVEEVVQIKGQSMSHPVLNSNDEFADFEMYSFTFAIGPPPPSRPSGSYVREAYQKGLQLRDQLGINPYQFGLIGSSDTHNSGGSIEENNYTGKFNALDGTPEKRLAPDDNVNVVRYKYMSAAGLAGVWAESNTRDAIFDALKRKETFATSGTRIKVRFYAGDNLDKIDLNDENWTSTASANGVSMGGELSNESKSPTFVVWAVKDPDGANLDRVQIIKSWLDKDGGTQEKIFNVAFGADRQIDDQGKLNPVGSTVDVDEATYSNTIGSVMLQATWQDPEFDPRLSAQYFVRVLEIPTPRWSTYDAKALGIKVPDTMDATIQERAWSSPIWYYPR